jgi:hypothetical protein
LRPITTLLLRLACLLARQASNHTPRNSEANENDDSQHYGYPHGYSTGEIKQNALNIHRDSVNLIGLIRNVTLVSIVVQAGLWWLWDCPPTCFRWVSLHTLSEFHVRFRQTGLGVNVSSSFPTG